MTHVDVAVWIVSTNEGFRAVLKGANSPEVEAFLAEQDAKHRAVLGDGRVDEILQGIGDPLRKSGL